MAPAETSPGSLAAPPHARAEAARPPGAARGGGSPTGGSHLGLLQRHFVAFAVMVSVGAGVLVLVLPDEWPGVAGMWLAALTAGWIVSRLGRTSLRRQMHRLREATDAIGAGELGHRVELRGHDEFAKLAGSLDRMAERLEIYLHERETLQKELGRVEKLALLGELAATVAHEVNNPLDGLQNAVRILKRTAPDDSQSGELLALMDSGLRRIERIVQRLLGLARPAEPRIEAVNVQEVLDDAMLFVQPRLNRDGIRVERDWPVPPLRARADHMQLAQVLINLMFNAADAMPGGGKLKIAGQLDAATDRVVIEIVDTGAGIDPADLPHIFEPFYTTKRHGTGLGLAVVARIIEGHQGRIDVRSQPGEGTTFTLLLPAA